MNFWVKLLNITGGWKEMSYLKLLITPLIIGHFHKTRFISNNIMEEVQ